jgi:hypothetical protein
MHKVIKNGSSKVQMCVIKPCAKFINQHKQSSPMQKAAQQPDWQGKSI